VRCVFTTGELDALREEDVRVLADDGAVYLVTRPSGERETAAEYLAEVRRHVSYVFEQPAQQATVVSNDGGSAERDTGHDGYTLASFAQDAHAVAAKLTIDECAALRIYTSSVFRLINGPLRKPSSSKLLSRQHHPLALTTVLISSAIKKLRANNMSGHKFQSRYLWRGVRNREVSNDFLLKGGSEPRHTQRGDSMHVHLVRHIGRRVVCALVGTSHLPTAHRLADGDGR